MYPPTHLGGRIFYAGATKAGKSYRFYLFS